MLDDIYRFKVRAIKIELYNNEVVNLLWLWRYKWIK